MPICTICNRPKAPHGRSIAAAAANSYCSYHCPGYFQEPESGHLWPEEGTEKESE